MPNPKATSHSALEKASDPLSDEQLLDLVQRQTFRYFWEGAHPVSGLALDRCHRRADQPDAPVSIGGSGFGIMALIVACERAWVSREQALSRLTLMLDCLEKATCYHGTYPHFVRGDSGATVPFSRKDDGADLVETSLLFQGLLCARAYFDAEDPHEQRVRERIGRVWRETEWDWYTQGGRKVLTWHWSPNNGFSLNNEIRGWNECLITYLLAVSAPRYRVPVELYHEGWAMSRDFINRRTFEGIELPLGPPWGGPLFLAHFSFCGLDPRGLSDRYADYWQQNVNHTRINYNYCLRNPHGYRGYGPDCWGLSAGDTPAVELPLCTARGHECVAPLLPGSGRSDLGTLWLRRRLQRAAGVVCGHIPRDQPGSDRGNDRELPQWAAVEAVHGHRGDPGGAEETRVPQSARVVSHGRARGVDRRSGALRCHHHDARHLGDRARHGAQRIPATGHSTSGIGAGIAGARPL
jgi:hypothetical protein